jgi:hypothetical protein
VKKQQQEELRQQLFRIASLALKMEAEEREALQLVKCCSTKRSRNLYDPSDTHRQALQDLGDLFRSAFHVAERMKPRGGAR